MATEPRVLRPANLEQGPIAAHDVHETSEFVGAEIRELRNARDITLKDLSEATSLSVGYLSQIERGISSPSIKALHTISRALGVTISWFFKDSDPASAEERGYVVRAAKRRKLRFSSGITDELLSPNLSRELELLCCTFAPGAQSGAAPYTHRGEETGVVISGTLELWVGARHFVLNEGDSFAFSSELPHRYRNPGASEAVVIWAITPPTY